MTNCKLFTSPKLTLLVFVVIYIFIRLLILFGSEDIFNIEELYLGAVAKEIIQGPSWPLFDYQQNVYEGRTLISGIMIVPFFLFFGESVISMKLLGVTWGLITFITFYLFLNKYFDYKVTLLASLMYLIPPPPLMYIDLCSVISGWFFFSVISLTIFFKIFSNKMNDHYSLQPVVNYDKSIVFFLIFGFMCGFFVYFHPLFLFALIPYLFFWFMLDYKFIFKRSFVYFIIFFIVGFFPCIYYNITRGFAGLNIKGEPLLSYLDIGNAFIKFKNLIINIRLLFQFYRNILINPVCSNIFFYSLLIISYCYLLWQNRAAILSLFLKSMPSRKNKIFSKKISIEIVFLFYPFLYLFVFSFVNTKRGIQTGDYILLYPFIFIIVSLFITKLWDMKRYIIYTTIFVIMFSILTMNIIGLVSSKKSNEIGSKYAKPYSYTALTVCFFIKHYWQNPAKCVEYINKIDKKNRRACYKGVKYFFRLFYPRSEKDEWSNSRKEYGKEHGYEENNTWGF